VRARAGSRPKSTELWVSDFATGGGVLAARPVAKADLEDNGVGTGFGDAAVETTLARFAGGSCIGPAMIRFALRSVGAMRLWPRFQCALHMCKCLVFDEIACRRRHPELGHNDLLDVSIHADGEPLSDNELRTQVFTIIGVGYGTALANWAIERLVQRARCGDRGGARHSTSRCPSWTRSCRKPCACARRSC